MDRLRIVMVAALLALSVVTQATQAAEPQRWCEYESAFRECDCGETPMVVLIGADWCPACVKIKFQDILPMLAAGEFSGANLVYLEYSPPGTPPVTPDQETAALLMSTVRPRTVPQLLFFSRTGKEWHLDRLSYPITRDAMRRCLQRAKQTMRGSQ